MKEEEIDERRCLKYYILARDTNIFFYSSFKSEIGYNFVKLRGNHFARKKKSHFPKEWKTEKKKRRDRGRKRKGEGGEGRDGGERA